VKTSNLCVLAVVLNIAAILLCATTARATNFCTPGSPPCVLSGGTPPTFGPAPGGAYTAMSSGVFTYAKTDLALPAPMPIAITRTYRSQALDTTGHFIASDFGLGTTLNYGIFLYSNSEVANGTYTDAEVVMPDGGEIKCQNEGGSSYQTALFLCDTQPIGPWFGSTIKWNSGTSQWNLTLKDQTVYAFGQGLPLQSITDRYGNSVTITRNASLVHCATKETIIRSYIGSTFTGRQVELCYDNSSWPTSISKIEDESLREVDYTYTSSNRLSVVTYKTYDANSKTTYSYGSGSQLGDIGVVTVAQSSTSNDSFDVSYDSTNSNRLKTILSLSPGALQYAYTTTGNPAYISSVTVTMPSGSGQPSAGSQRTLNSTQPDTSPAIREESIAVRPARPRLSPAAASISTASALSW
jgi:hypothetical protein